jgi:hypothetical protein
MRMIRITLASLLLLTACATAQAAAPNQCPPAGYDRAALEALKANDWVIADDAARNPFARALTACLASPDPALRDGIAFEAFAHMLRARQLSTETMLALNADLQARLIASEGAGFERPFAALVLSEVARADRIEAYLSEAQRAELLDAAITYFTGVRDYRGFDAQEGWRHGVAHGADLLMQLSLNPALGKADLIRIRDALETQVAPEEHFYIYGEPERLAYPIIYMARRDLITEDEWTRWFARFPAAGEDVFASQGGLAWRHDVNAFLSALYVNARASEDTYDDAILPGVEAALRAMP